MDVEGSVPVRGRDSRGIEWNGNCVYATLLPTYVAPLSIAQCLME